LPRPRRLGPKREPSEAARVPRTALNLRMSQRSRRKRKPPRMSQRKMPKLPTRRQRRRREPTRRRPRRKRSRKMTPTTRMMTKLMTRGAQSRAQSPRRRSRLISVSCSVQVLKLSTGFYTQNILVVDTFFYFGTRSF